MSSKVINVVGAREHNLKNISLKIPRDKLVVMTGLSGSGKSSLAFDTIYAEGQRRYVESLSAYARQFLEMMQKPDVDQIDGLSPAISIEQKTTSKNPRSTVGTVTEIYDYLRLLFARVGTPYSPATGLPIASMTVSQMVDQVLSMEEGTRFYLLAPVVRGRKGEFRKDLAGYQKSGFQRVKINGTLHAIEEAPKLDKKFKHDIDVVVDRLVVNADMATRLADSFETALKLAEGIAVIEMADEVDDAGKPKRIIFSEKFACPVSGFTISEIEPRLFSFNSPHGACPDCDGLGFKLKIDPELIIADPAISLAKGAISPWSKSSSTYVFQTLKTLASHYDFSMDTPWASLDEAAQKVILYGSGKEKLTFRFTDGSRKHEIQRSFEGVIPNLERRYRETDSNWMRDEIARYQSSVPCGTCQGTRLKPEALAVKIDQHTIADTCLFSIAEAKVWFANLNERLTEKEQSIAVRILREINERLGFLNNVGLGYLSLSRSSATLSGGESQRIRLASQIGSGLTGVLYVLDEPSIGLHQRDNARLLETLFRLRDLGNSVLVVEHDEDAIMSADYVVDIGPKAGIYGGQIIAEGTPEVICASAQSLTGRYLSGDLSIVVPDERRPVDLSRSIHLQGARANNLKNIDVRFPLGVLTCVTGVSGSGKSSLLLDTLYAAAARTLNNSRKHIGAHDCIEGFEHLDKVIDIDQSPIGRTPRSNPATYTGAFGPIRDWFAGLPEAKARGYGPGRFSFNVKGGRCEACQGDGMIKIEMHFLPDVYVTCDQCKGQRYNRETLEVTFKGKSIADILNMSIEEGLDFFSAIPSVRNKLDTLNKVGLGYINIGQSATTLSGGEAQRIKLSKELSRRSTGRTLYILDEPTTGLHFHDVAKLLDVLHSLVEEGNTVIVIEHNLEIIKTADWLIDVGPEGGNGGGTIVAEGRPEEVAEIPESFTGYYLKPVLERASKGRIGGLGQKSAAKTQKNQGLTSSKSGKNSQTKTTSKKATKSRTRVL